MGLEEVGGEVRKLTDCVELLGDRKDVGNLVDLEVHYPAPFQGKTRRPAEETSAQQKDWLSVPSGSAQLQNCLFGGYALPSTAEVWLPSQVGG